MMAMMAEVLPAPFGPSSANTEPAGTSMLRSSTARMAPYPQLRCSSRSMRLPEIRRAHGGVGHDLVRRAVLDQTALIENEKATAHAHHLSQVVLDQDDGGAGSVDTGNDIREPARLSVIESGERLVEQNENGIDRKRAGNLEPLEMTKRQYGDRFMLLRRQTNARKDLARSRLFAPAPIAQQGAQWVGSEPVTGGQSDIVQRGHGSERAHDLVRDRKPAAHAQLGRQARDIAVADRDPAGIRRKHAGDDPHQRRLAGTVRPNQPDQLAARDGEADSGDSIDPTEADGDRIDHEHGRHRARALARTARPMPASPPGAKRTTRIRRAPKTSSR